MTANTWKPSKLGRRDFLHQASVAAVAIGAGTLLGTGQTAKAQAAPGGFTLPPLPYAYNALEPYIDAQTMQIHHDKHHQAYITKLNEALQGHPELQSKSIDELLAGLDAIPEPLRTSIRNQGGGHYNHSMFWQIMGPGKGGEPSGALAQAISGTFNSFANFKMAFTDAGVKRFGSGWAWLSVDPSGKFAIESSANQDCPVSAQKKPLVGLDVWEHAYYLKYKNVRPEYIAAWWNVVNWDAVSDRFSAATKA